MRCKIRWGGNVQKNLFKSSGDAEKAALAPAEKKPVLDRWMEQQRK